MSTYAADWDKALSEFEKIIGKAKPSAKLQKAFKTSKIDADLKDCDGYIKGIEDEFKDMVRKAKLIVIAKKQAAVIAKSASTFMKLLEEAIKDEVADNAGAKTDYSKGLKFLKSSLDAAEKAYDAKVNGYEIAMNTELSGFEKASRMVHKSLISTIAIAAAGVKEVKAKPTKETFNKVFAVSDNVARKVQVQLVQADNAINKGVLPSAAAKRVDPRYIADMLTPWQAGGKGLAVAGDDWGAPEVIQRLAEFAKILKLAGAFCDDLDAAV